MAEAQGRRVALVTGASYGIGGATAVGLAEDGFDVVVTDLKTDDLAETVSKIEAAGGRALPLALDVRSQESIEKVFAEAVAKMGPLYALVNNAGIPSPGKQVVDLTRADWDPLMAINLTGVFFMSREMGRQLIAAKREGVIVSLASTHGTVGFAGASAYGIAKAGVSHMTKMLAIE